VPAEPESGDYALLTPWPASSRTEERNGRTVDIDRPGPVRPGRGTA